MVLSRYIVSVETPGSKDSSKDGPFSLAQAGTTAWLPLSPVQPVTSMQVPLMNLFQSENKQLLTAKV